MRHAELGSEGTLSCEPRDSSSSSHGGRNSGTAVMRPGDLAGITRSSDASERVYC